MKTTLLKLLSLQKAPLDEKYKTQAMESLWKSISSSEKEKYQARFKSANGNESEREFWNVIAEIRTDLGDKLKYCPEFANWYERLGARQIFASIPIQGKIKDDLTLLQTVAATGNIRLTRFVCELPGIKPSLGKNIIFRQAAERGDTKMINFLITHPDVNPTAKNNSALKSAIKNKKLPTVSLLLKLVPNPFTCINLAVKEKQFQFFRTQPNFLKKELIVSTFLMQYLVISQAEETSLLKPYFNKDIKTYIFNQLIRWAQGELALNDSIENSLQ